MLGFVAALGLWACPVLAAGSIEGRWRLVEQHAGSGRADLARDQRPIRIEFVASATGSLSGRLWIGDPPAGPYAWPSFASSGSLRPVSLEETRLDRDEAVAQYRVAPGAAGDRTLRIREEYRLTAGGGALSGVIRITELEGDEPRGSYVIHRRFELEP
jgi:hypothetical protein